MNKDLKMTGEVLAEFIQKHEVKKVRYMELYNQYLSKPPILDEPAKEEEWKPDNRLVGNFGRYLVDTFNGFFNGIPMRPSHDDKLVNEIVQDFWKANNMDDTMNELAKSTSIYGRAYLFLFQNEESKTEVAYNDPLDMFVIYSDEVRPRSLYGVRYAVDEDNKYKGQLFSDSEAYDFVLDGDSLSMTDSSTFTDNFIPYGRVPMIEFIENEERQSLIEPVESLINGFNNVLSEKNNDVSYFSDAYLAILGALLDDDSIRNLKDNRIINLAGENAEKVTVEFLEKPDADQTQENFLDRTERLIYQLSQVANIDDTTFGSAGNNSGVALEFKLQPMKNLASNKERKFQRGLQTLFSMVFNVITNVPNNLSSEYLDIQYNWSRNLPANNADEASVVRSLDGIVSHKTQLDMLSAIQDSQKELDRIEEENKPLDQYDFEKSE